MMVKLKDDPALAELARSLGHFTEADLCRLARATPSTVEAWRKRHVGPDYVLIGNTFLYPREALQEFLQGRLRKMRGTISPKAVL